MSFQHSSPPNSQGHTHSCLHHTSSSSPSTCGSLHHPEVPPELHPSFSDLLLLRVRLVVGEAHLPWLHDLYPHIRLFLQNNCLGVLLSPNPKLLKSKVFKRRLPSSPSKGPMVILLFLAPPHSFLGFSFTLTPITSTGPVSTSPDYGSHVHPVSLWVLASPPGIPSTPLLKLLPGPGHL